MKDRECQDNGGSHDEVAHGQVDDRRLCPQRHAGEVEQQGRHAGQFKSAADGQKNVEKADKHHGHADEHHRDVQVAVIRAVVRSGRALSLLFIRFHGDQSVSCPGALQDGCMAEAFKLFAEGEALPLIGRADPHAVDFIRCCQHPLVN